MAMITRKMNSTPMTNLIETLTNIEGMHLMMTMNMTKTSMGRSDDEGEERLP